MKTSTHMMITRSKASSDITPHFDDINSDKSNDDLDEHGNIKDLIDYDMEEDDSFKKELQQQLYIISNGSSIYKTDSLDEENNIEFNHPKRKPRNKSKKNNSKLNHIFLDYLIMKATNKANEGSYDDTFLCNFFFLDLKT